MFSSIVLQVRVLLALTALIVSSAGASLYAFSVEDASLFYATFTNGQTAMLNGKALIVIDDGIHGAELWISDGTSSGTSLLRDIRAGVAGGEVRNITTVGNVAYFSANNGSSGAELWRTNGTTAGTVQVLDLVSGSGSSTPGGFVAIGSTIYFVASHPQSGRELWKTNGTAAGTLLVADIHAGSASSNPAMLTALGNTVFFSAEAPLASSRSRRAGSSLGRELWKSDGTAAGTVLVKDINAGFTGSDPGNLVTHNGALYFAATTANTGNELWRSDGTAAGTFLLRDISRGLIGSFPRNVTPFRGFVYFNTGGRLWRTDGTSAGTLQVEKLLPPSFAQTIGPKVGARLSLIVDTPNGTELWSTDGTAAGSQFLHRLAPNDPNLVELGLGFRPNIIGAGALLFFNAFTFERGTSLLASDGTAAVKGPIRTFSGEENSRFLGPTLILGEAGRVFLAADSGVSGYELWISDATDAGTRIVKDILAD